MLNNMYFFLLVVIFVFKCNILSLTQGISIGNRSVVIMLYELYSNDPLFLFQKIIPKYYTGIIFYFCIVKCKKATITLLVKS